MRGGGLLLLLLLFWLLVCGGEGGGFLGGWGCGVAVGCHFEGAVVCARLRSMGCGVCAGGGGLVMLCASMRQMFDGAWREVDAMMGAKARVGPSSREFHMSALYFHFTFDVIVN